MFSQPCFFPREPDRSIMSMFCDQQPVDLRQRSSFLPAEKNLNYNESVEFKSFSIPDFNCMCVCVYLDMCISIYTYIYIHIDTHTHPLVSVTHHACTDIVICMPTSANSKQTLHAAGASSGAALSVWFTILPTKIVYPMSEFYW